MKFENKNIKDKGIAFASKKLEIILEKNNWDLRLSIKGEMTGFLDPDGGIGFVVKDKEKGAEFIVEASEAIHSENITRKDIKCHFLEFLKMGMGEEIEVTGIVIPNMVIPGKDGGYISMVAEKINGTGVMLGDGSGQGKVLKIKGGFTAP